MNVCIHLCCWCRFHSAGESQHWPSEESPECYQGLSVHCGTKSNPTTVKISSPGHLGVIINHLISQLNITLLFACDLPPMMAFNHVNRYYSDQFVYTHCFVINFMFLRWKLFARACTIAGWATVSSPVPLIEERGFRAGNEPARPCAGACSYK